MTYRSEKVRTVLITRPADVIGRAVIARIREANSTRRRLSTVGIGTGDRRTAGPDRTIGSAVGTAAFGAPGREYRSAAAEVDVVVHIGAQLAIGAPSPAERSAMREVIDFARLAGASIVYVSTAFGDEAGGGPSGPRRTGCEQLLASSGIPHLVVRPSIVTGGDDQAETPVAALRALLDRAIPPAPALDQRRLDLVPAELVADAIVRLIDNEVPSGEFWLTAGEHALTVGRAVALLADESRRRPAATVTGLPPARSADPRRGSSPAGDQAPGAVVVDLLAESLLRGRPLESSLGNGFENALGELGALGLAPLPDPRETLLRALGLVGRHSDSRSA